MTALCSSTEKSISHCFTGFVFEPMGVAPLFKHWALLPWFNYKYSSCYLLVRIQKDTSSLLGSFQRALKHTKKFILQYNFSKCAFCSEHVIYVKLKKYFTLCNYVKFLHWTTQSIFFFRFFFQGNDDQVFIINANRQTVIISTPVLLVQKQIFTF